MVTHESNKELEVLQQIISSLAPLEKDTQVRILKSVATFLQIRGGDIGVAGAVRAGQIGYRPEEAGVVDSGPTFSQEADLSPKEFLVQKNPLSGTERVACLAYYLTHYRATPHFKTLDISQLNTEAAQPKFSNPAYFISDTSKRGLLVPAGKGKKQLGAVGEQFVEALPNHEEALKTLRRLKPRRVKKRRSLGKTKVRSSKKVQQG